MKIDIYFGWWATTFYVLKLFLFPNVKHFRSETVEILNLLFIVLRND